MALSHISRGISNKANQVVCSAHAHLILYVRRGRTRDQYLHLGGRSVRAFRPAAEGSDFFLLTESAGPAVMMDSATGSRWDFTGCAVDGKSKGVCLAKLDLIADYWFNWRNYNPDTTVYRR